MNTNLKNSGLTVLNVGNLPKGEPATIIVIGVARSGTSMVGSTLNKLGVFLGERADKAVFEDPILATAIENNRIDDVKSIIETNNILYPIWGFKRPESFDFLPRILKLFRSPRIVATFRDPASIAKRNEISMHSDFLTLLRRSAERSVHLVAFLEKVQAPTLVVSYEKALSNPNLFLDTLVEFCGLNPTKEQHENALAAIQNGPDVYLKSSRVWYEGRFDGIMDGVAYGWARRQPGNNVCSVEIRSGGEILGSGPASHPRQDLLQDKIGARAFRIPLSHEVIRESLDTLEARVVGTNYTLMKSQGFRLS